MADTRKITIELITGNGDGENKQLKTSEGKEAEEKKNQKQKFKDYAIKSAKKLATQALNAGMDRYFSLTEDYATQNDMQNIKNVISGTYSLVTSLAVASATMGPVGLAASATVWGLEKIITTRSGYSEIRRGINASNYELRFQSTRMSLVDNGRGTEN